MPRLSSIAAAALLSSACGCIIGSGPSGSANPPGPAAAAPLPRAPAPAAVGPGVAAPRVAEHWQDRMLSLLMADATRTEAFGLFSEGGWSDAGQVMVLVGPKESRLFVAAANRDEKAPWEVDRAMTKDEQTSLQAALGTAAKLTDIDITAFDALTFEYVHARRGPAGATVVQRLFIRNPGVKPTPDHDRLVEVFQNLRPKR